MTPIEGHQCIGLTIERGFQHQFIGRIPKLGPPQEMDIDRFSNRGNSVEKYFDLGVCQPRRRPMFGPLTHLRVLNY